MENQNRIPIGLCKQATMKLDAFHSDLREIIEDEGLRPDQKQMFEQMAEISSDMLAGIISIVTEEMDEESFLHEQVEMDAIDEWPNLECDVDWKEDPAGILDEPADPEKPVQLTLAGVLKEKTKENLILAVGGSEFAYPHFHVFRKQMDLCQWKHGGSLCFQGNQYYDDNINGEQFTEEELASIQRLLESGFQSPNRQMTNWQYLVELWNQNNQNELPYDLDLPDYAQKELQVFDENIDMGMEFTEEGNEAWDKRMYKVFGYRNPDRDPSFYIELAKEDPDGLLDEYYDENCASYMEMAVVAYEPDLNISVNQEVKRLSIAYFKVYDNKKFHAAKRVARLHFKDSGMEYYNDDNGKEIWKTTKSDIKRIIKLMQAPSDHEGYTNWQMACYQWNHQNGLVRNFKDYFDGKYDHIYDQDSRLKEAYVPSTQEMPETWGEDDLLNESIEFEEKYTENVDALSDILGKWDGFAPYSVNMDNVEDFFVEMAEIYPKYIEDHNIKKVKFRVCIFEGDNEGPVPHVHVFFDHKWDKNHGKDRTVAYICLGTNEYAPQHDKETKILNSKERKALIAFFNAKIPNSYAKDKNGEIYQLSCWQECVSRWVQNHHNAEKYFEVDEETGLYVMPDYSEINIPKKNNAVTERINEILSFKVGDIVKESNDPDHIYVIKNISEFTNNKFGYDLVSINEDSNELYCHSGELLEFQYHDSKLEEYYKENIMESTGILDEEVIEEGDNSILLLEMAGKLKETAKPTKPKNEELIVAVGNDERSVAHFHVFRNQKDWRQWQNGACIMFEKNAYFDHAKNRAILKKEELEAVISLLKSDFDIPNWNITNWEYLVDLWNQNNDRYEIPYDLEMPSYSFDTIQTYQETKDNKKVYDESSNFLDEEVYDLLNESEFDEDDNSILLLEMAGRIPGEIKLDNPKNPGLIIAVGSNESRGEAHFHIFRSQKDWKQWKNGACLCFKKNKYFDHKDNDETLTKEELEAVVKCLKDKPASGLIGETNWQFIITLWNSSNYDWRIDIDTPMPKYDYDTIARYKEDDITESANDEIIDQYFDGITTVARDTENKILIIINQERDRLNIPYFTVYDNTMINTAKRVVRFHFKDNSIEYYNDPLGNTAWNLNDNDLKNIINILNKPSEKFKGYTNWQATCYEWNYQNGLVEDISNYFDGKYDHIYDQNSRLKEAYVPSTQEMPETWGR